MKMDGLNHIERIRQYCDYVEEHLLNVQKAWAILQEALKHENVIWDDHLFWIINRMVQEHDVSKLSPEEFVQYQRNFFPVDKPDKAGFVSAWEHHKEHNPHHWQTWPSAPEHFPNEHSCHVVCMVADWMAMGMKFGDTAEQYYEAHKDEINMPQWAERFLSDIFKALKEQAGKKEPTDER